MRAESGVRLYLTEVLALVNEALHSAVWSLRRQGAAVSCSVARTLGTALEWCQVETLVRSLLAALPGRTWHGKTHALRGDPCPGGKHSQVRVTVLLCVSMDGSHRLKPFIIGQSKEASLLQKSAPLRPLSQQQGGLDDRQLVREVAARDGRCHRKPGAEGLQPLDAGVIANFKALYWLCMFESLELTIDRSAPGMPGNADGPPDLKISLLKAVCFVYGTWYDVKQSTIQNCFKKAGFVRQDQPPPPA
ncbi:hypothetical protein HPB50_017727 [Hyalomma asiaticum]|uniref:Uncharacterized protein n=1 Tax=Hyalomma asiaticum TaxID=266040 RepID=A0ACB7T1T5_HYAAI|nr:hypothetical protein HPB50_017727 [Hyalomma asiaticum]